MHSTPYFANTTLRSCLLLPEPRWKTRAHLVQFTRYNPCRDVQILSAVAAVGVTHYIESETTTNVSTEQETWPKQI
jgi:hypothetical protein